MSLFPSKLMRSMIRLICALNVIGKIVNIFIVKNRFRLKVQWKGCKVQCACKTFKLQITPSLIQIILGAIQSVLFMSLSLRIAPKNSLAWFPHILSTIWGNTVYIFFNWLSGCLLRFTKAQLFFVIQFIIKGLPSHRRRIKNFHFILGAFHFYLFDFIH